MQKGFRAVIGLMWAGIFFLAGCATTGDYATTPVSPSAKGIYHKVEKGETLWRIAQSYGVSLDDLKKVNHIPDAAMVEQGQLLLIPGAVVDKPQVPTAPDLNSREFTWPVQGQVMEYYGVRKGLASSKGIGISVPEGSKVMASRQGKVVFADYLSGYGFTVMLDHEDGFYSVYSNNSQVLVKSGEHVTKGEAIATMGSKGLLHFEIRHNTIAENPLSYLSKT